MIVNYRVSAAPLDGTPFIMEQFETRTDADAFYRDLQEGADGILDAVPYRCVALTFEEFLGGSWVVTNRRTAIQ